MKEFLEDFEETVKKSVKRLSKLSDQESGIAKTPDKWSAKQIIGHLIDSAANNHQRFVRAQFGDDLVFPGYDQEKWVKVQRYDLSDWNALINLWNSYNFHIIHVVKQIPESDLFKSRSKHNLDQIAWKTVPVSESVTLDYFIRDYVGHLKNHLDQIWSQYKV
ncbi:MAG TPA: DinB family protein [bacterium]|nr:DinB family protein [bacterium]HMW36042.1 DinB family protein [bacterium]HMZ05517.1 DinB family protein [bacterium]HNB10717.1 DinB family protein [bacterium]HNB56594.1 DinB family protein [bacterium]